MLLLTCVNTHVCMSMCLSPELNSPALVFTCCKCLEETNILLIGPRLQCIPKDRPGKQGGKSCKHTVLELIGLGETTATYCCDETMRIWCMNPARYFETKH